MNDPVQISLALVCHEGRWLVSRRAPGRPFAGLWEFPGGRIEPGESPGQAAVREVLEETGLTVTAERPLGTVRSDHAGGHFLLHLVICRFVAGVGEVCDPAVTHVRWVSFDELQALSTPPVNAEIIARLPRPASSP